MCVSGSRRVQLSATPWIVASQAPLSIEFSRQEYRNGWPFSSPGHENSNDKQKELEVLKECNLNVIEVWPMSQPATCFYMTSKLNVLAFWEQLFDFASWLAKPNIRQVGWASTSLGGLVGMSSGPCWLLWVSGGHFPPGCRIEHCRFSYFWLLCERMIAYKQKKTKKKNVLCQQVSSLQMLQLLRWGSRP